MDQVTEGCVTRVLRWAGTTRGVAQAVILVHETGWLHDQMFVRECTVASLDDPDRITEIDWLAVDRFIARQTDTRTDALRALSTARSLAPPRRRSA